MPMVKCVPTLYTTNVLARNNPIILLLDVRLAFGNNPLSSLESVKAELSNLFHVIYLLLAKHIKHFIKWDFDLSAVHKVFFQADL